MPWFGLSHWLGLALVVLLCLGVGRAPAGWRQAMSRILLFNLLIYIVIAYATRWTHLNLATCLPLHLCDFILLGALVLLAGWRRSSCYECICLWSWSGSIWALITPDLPFDFPHYRYFEFFWGHGLIFVILAHLEGNCGYVLRPDSWKRAALGLQFWVFGVGLLDYCFGWNYGYLLYKPPAGSPLDYLGPWPLYILWADLLAVAFFYWLCRWRSPRLSPLPTG